MIEEMGQINQALQAVSHAAENVQAGRAVEDLDPAPFRLPAKSVTSVIRLSRMLSIRGMKAGILGCPRPTGVVFCTNWMMSRIISPIAPSPWTIWFTANSPLLSEIG